MVAGLPGKGAISLDAPLCAVTIAWGDVMTKILLANNFIAAGWRLQVSFCCRGGE